MMFFLQESYPTTEAKVLSAIVPVVLTVVFYSIYWYVAGSGKLKKRFNRDSDLTGANVVQVVLKRLSGLLLLGIMPVLLARLLTDFYAPAEIGLEFRPETTGFTLISVMLLSGFIIPVVSFTSRKPSVYDAYPEIRATNWTGRLLFAELFTWALYLLGYEVLFRGVLLFGLTRSLGPVPAIIISTLLYSAAHLPKSKTETVASIPFGVVLCILTLYSGSIWIAFIAHMVNCITMTLTAINSNPGMSYANTGKKVSAV
ncbi:MAG: CPBP family intramembrane metalloprotease [Bacteroidota bacterium]|nr:CPBP family intramembrane metalloprotease [Bacteroidota bacterium]